MPSRAAAASAEISARTPGGTAFHAPQRTRNIWCSTLAPSIVNGAGGNWAIRCLLCGRFEAGALLSPDQETAREQRGQVQGTHEHEHGRIAEMLHHEAR